MKEKLRVEVENGQVVTKITICAYILMHVKFETKKNLTYGTCKNLGNKL